MRGVTNSGNNQEGKTMHPTQIFTINRENGKITIATDKTIANCLRFIDSFRRCQRDTNKGHSRPRYRRSSQRIR